MLNYRLDLKKINDEVTLFVIFFSNIAILIDFEETA